MTIALFKWYLKMNSEVQTGDTFQGKSTKSSFITAFLYAVSTKRNYVWIRIRENRIIRPYGRSLLVIGLKLAYNTVSQIISFNKAMKPVLQVLSKLQVFIFCSIFKITKM